jgi:hypothetical protein
MYKKIILNIIVYLVCVTPWMAFALNLTFFASGYGHFSFKINDIELAKIDAHTTPIISDKTLKTACGINVHNCTGYLYEMFCLAGCREVVIYKFILDADEGILFFSPINKYDNNIVYLLDKNIIGIKQVQDGGAIS